MRIVFMGTPEFAIAPLKALLSFNKCQVVAVVSNVDKPVGRKQILTPPPVKVVAKTLGIPVYQYTKIKTEGLEDLKLLNPDVIVTCAFGQILSQEILDIPKFGVINVHASLLPKYRGASPIHYAILNGEKTTGVTIMKTDVGIDTGDMILKQQVCIGENETCGELFERLSLVGAELLIEALNLIMEGKAVYEKQDEEKATYTKIIKKELALIDFNKPAENVVNQIRAFNPSPVAFTYLSGEQYKIYSATAVLGDGKPGEILSTENGKLIIACRTGAISVNVIQKQGGKAIKVSDFLRGNKLENGGIFSK